MAKATVPGEYGSESDLETSLQALANSFLHQIAAWANIFSYYDVIRWVIYNVTIHNKTFVSAARRTFGSFKEEDIKAMYHLPDPQKIYNKAFIKDFAANNENQSEPIREWRRAPEKHKNEALGMYSVESLSPPYYYAAAMMCQLFGNDNSTRFSIQMVPLIHYVVNY